MYPHENRRVEVDKVCCTLDIDGDGNNLEYCCLIFQPASASSVIRCPSCGLRTSSRWVLFWHLAGGIGPKLESVSISWVSNSRRRGVSHVLTQTTSSPGGVFHLRPIVRSARAHSILLCCSAPPSLTRLRASDSPPNRRGRGALSRRLRRLQLLEKRNVGQRLCV